MSEDRAGIEEVIAQYADALSTGDLAAWTSTLADDVVFHAQDVREIVGQSAVAAWAKESWFDRFKIDLKFETQESEIFDSWAFARGLFSLGLIPSAGGDVTLVNGKFLNIFRPAEDGSWRYSRASFTFDAAYSGD